MREIKFRAYYKPTGEMFEVTDLTPRPEGGMVTGFFDGKRDYCYYSHDGKYGDAIISEYTGLKDMNGVEIYEGDIVTWYVNDIERTAPVYYDEDQASFWMGEDMKGRGGLVLNDWMRGVHEVIGNIYEGESK